MKLPSLLPVFLLAAFPLLAQTPKPAPAPSKPAFQTLRSEAFKFSVDTPGKVSESVEEVPTKMGTIKVHEFALDCGDSGAFLLMCNEYPSGYTYEAQKVLEAGLKGGVDNAKGRLEWQHPLSLNGTPGIEARILSEKFVIQLRIYFVDRRLYQLMVLAPLGQDLPRGSTRFFDSFQLLP